MRCAIVFSRKWHDRDTALAEDAAELERYREAAETGDFDTALIWAGEAVDMVNSIEPASAIVERLGRDAEAWLRQAQTMVQEQPR